MNPIQHLVAQTVDPKKAVPASAESIRAKEPTKHKISLTQPNVQKRGPQIEALTIAGMGYKQIAAQLGLSPNTVRVTYSRYRKAKAQGLI